MDTRCRFCRRQMSDPISIKVGFGPTCAKKHGLKVQVRVERKGEAGAGEAVYAPPEDFF